MAKNWSKLLMWSNCWLWISTGANENSPNKNQEQKAHLISLKVQWSHSSPVALSFSDWDFPVVGSLMKCQLPCPLLSERWPTVCMYERPHLSDSNAQASCTPALTCGSGDKITTGLHFNTLRARCKCIQSMSDHIGLQSRYEMHVKTRSKGVWLLKVRWSSVSTDYPESQVSLQILLQTNLLFFHNQ